MNAVDLAKRALVKLLKGMAVLYKPTATITRDSPNPEVRTAYRKVSVKTHPDRGGDDHHQRQLNAAYSAWETAAKDTRPLHRRRNVQLVSIPARSPDLNPIERFWG